MLASYCDRGTVLTSQIKKIDDTAYYLNRSLDSTLSNEASRQLIKVPYNLIKPVSSEDKETFSCISPKTSDMTVLTRQVKYITDRLQGGDIVPYIFHDKIAIGKIEKINPKTYEIDSNMIPHTDIILDEDAFKPISPRSWC
jgi:hypothetical protein